MPPTDVITTRPARPVVLEDVEFVETTPVPADPTHARLSAAVLLGSLIAAGAGAHRQPDGTELAAGAVFAALVLFLACLARYNLAAQAAE